MGRRRSRKKDSLPVAWRGPRIERAQTCQGAHSVRVSVSCGCRSSSRLLGLGVRVSWSGSRQSCPAFWSQTARVLAQLRHGLCDFSKFLHSSVCCNLVYSWVKQAPEEEWPRTELITQVKHLA